MSIVRREYNPQTRELRQVGGTMGGAAGDNSAVTIQFTYPENYLEDKDAYIAFNVLNKDTENLYWFSFNGTEFTIPYTVIANATRNKLNCQIILIGKTNTNYVEYSRITPVMFIRPDLSYPMIEAESIDAVTDLAQLREMTSEIIVDALDEIKEYIRDHLGESQSEPGGSSSEPGELYDTLNRIEMTLSDMASRIGNIPPDIESISTRRDSIDQVSSGLSVIFTSIDQLSERIQTLENKIDHSNEVR